MKARKWPLQLPSGVRLTARIKTLEREASKRIEVVRALAGDNQVLRAKLEDDISGDTLWQVRRLVDLAYLTRDEFAKAGAL